MRSLKAATLFLVLLVNALALLWMASLRVVPAAADRIADLNGDIDGDGRRNVTDAVRLLQWLFQHGPAPVPVACAQEAPMCCPEIVEELRGLRAELSAKWPPRPEDIVSWAGTVGIRRRTTLVEVPADKWFILTSVEAPRTIVVRIYEESDAGDDLKLERVDAPAGVQLPAGIPFRPESRVVLIADGGFSDSFLLNGYFVRVE